jgi:hypothetical protein
VSATSCALCRVNRSALQKIKITLLLKICFLSFMLGCFERRPNEAIVDYHDEAIRKFQTAQLLFKETIATVSDETSYDKALRARFIIPMNPSNSNSHTAMHAPCRPEAASA